MAILRAILILVILAVTPVHVASAAGAPLPGPTMAAMDHSAMPDCCQDGSHQTPACQMQADLREQVIPWPRRHGHALRVAFRPDRLIGRMPGRLLPPPRAI